MWEYYYKLICTLEVQAKDAQYEVRFKEEHRKCPRWHVEPMCDAFGEYAETTGDMCVEFKTFGYMAFPEDEKRPQEYTMPKEAARRLYKLLRDDKPVYWFALDMASLYSKS